MIFAGSNLIDTNVKVLFKNRGWGLWTWGLVTLEDPEWYLDRVWVNSAIMHRCMWLPRHITYHSPESIDEANPHCRICYKKIPSEVFGLWQLHNMDEWRNKKDAG